MIPCCPWLPIHCPGLWDDGHLSTFPETWVHHVTQACLPWPWLPASLFHSLPRQPSCGPLPIPPGFTQMLSACPPRLVKSKFLCSAFKGATLAPAPSQLNVLLCRLCPNQAGLSPHHTQHMPAPGLLPMLFLPTSSCSFVYAQLQCHLFQEVSLSWHNQMPFLSPCSSDSSLPASHVFSYHGHLRLFLPVIL